MYVRQDTRTRRDGTQVRHLSLAHNVRETVVGKDGKPTSRSKPVIFARLGLESDLDESMVRGARDAFDRYLRKRFGDAVADRATVEEAAEQLEEIGPLVKVLASRSYGMSVVVEAVWRELGLATVFADLATQSKCTFSLERVVFAMVLNRLVDPMSKRACNEWVANEGWVEGLDVEGVGVQHFYRALDLLHDHADAVLAAVGASARARCTEEELTLLLMDTTTTYSESDLDDVERKQVEDEWLAFAEGAGPEPTEPMPQVVNDPPLRMRGHSKDKRPREPQVKVAILTTTDRRLVHVQTVAGNESDQKQTLRVAGAARDALPEHAVALVMDSGMGGNANLKALDAMDPPMHRVSGVPLRNSRFAEELLLSKAGRWARHPYKEGFTYRAERVEATASPSGRAEWWVATRNHREAQRHKRVIAKTVAKAKAAIRQANAKEGDDCAAACSLLSGAGLKRYVEKTESGRYRLHRDRIRLEERRAGVKVTRSTLIEQDAETTLRAYDAQYGIEDEMRTYKGPLKLRPMHHRASRRIQAHVLVCSLALMVLRELERRTGETFATVQRTLSRVRVLRMQQGRTTFWQREEWGDEAAAMLQQCGVAEGARTWGATTA